MDAWDVIARNLEQNRNEVKWQESVRRTAAALRSAYKAGREEADDYRLPEGTLHRALRRGQPGAVLLGGALTIDRRGEPGGATQVYIPALPQGDGHP